MAEKKGTFLSRLLKRLLIFVLVLVFLATGGYLFVRFYYGVDLITTFTHFAKLTKAVDEESTFTNKFTIADQTALKGDLDTSIGNYIVGNETDGYTINNDAELTPLSSDLNLSDKEVGALVDIILTSNETNTIALGDAKVTFRVIQIQFSNLSDDGKSVDFNVVVKLDLSAFKEAKMSKFPLKYLKKYVPNYLYMSSTVTVTHGEEAFEYTVSGGNLAINGLTQKETDSLLGDIKRIFKTSGADEIARQFATPIVDGIIGTNENQGLARQIGSNYAFVTGIESSIEFKVNA